MSDSTYYGVSGLPLSRNEKLLMQIKEAIENGGGGGGGDRPLFKVVDALPTEDISTSTIYMVKSNIEGQDDIYIEYVYINGKWERFGQHQDGTGIDYDKLNGLPEDIPAGYVDSLFDDV